MPRDLILGTAGHIDHGKTSLVRALTGTDCDRLPEEKARGITIDIGFAQLDLGGGWTVGVVDVPGHERFIRNMVAGAAGIDLALFVVAADDGVMPQTREHLAILRMLRIPAAVVALTKSDIADAATLEVREIEVREFLLDSFPEAPIVPVSSRTGAGLPELRAALRAAAERELETRSERGPGGWFRMAIDRAFTLAGHGTVVTGSVDSGSLNVEDEVEWLPAGKRVRVRSLHSHDRPVESVHKGMRAAINLAGVPLDDVYRGQELARPGFLQPSKVLTVHLSALAQNRRPIKHRAEARLHIGTAEVPCTVSLLDCDTVDPGKSALAQLFLRDAVTAVGRQPFVLRGPSAEDTLGGGHVLQPTAVKIRRRHLDTLVRIERLLSPEDAARAEVVAWAAGYRGAAAEEIVRGADIDPESVPDLLRELEAAGRIANVAVKERTIALHIDRWAELEVRVLEVLAELHAAFPLLTNHERPKVVARFGYVGNDDLMQGVIDGLIRNKKLAGDGRWVARADFKPKLSANQRKIKDRIAEAHRLAKFQPPEPGSFANAAGGNAGSLGDIFEVAVAEGVLARIADGIHLHAEAEAEMRQLVAAKLAEGVGLTVADIRDLLGTTRKYAVPLCEYLDRIGLTRRDGDLRFAAEAGEIRRPPSGRSAGSG